MRSVSRLDSVDVARILEGAKTKAEGIGVEMCIAVMDESCKLLAFVRMDLAKVTSITFAIDKGFTVAGTRKLTQDLARPSMPGNPVYGLTSTIGGRIVVIAGGLPILANGDVIGAIGVSSGPPAKDLEVAQAGVQAFANE